MQVLHGDEETELAKIRAMSLFEEHKEVGRPVTKICDQILSDPWAQA